MKERPLNAMPLCDFDALQQEISQGDVLLIEGRSRVSDIIKTLTKSNWSHSAIYVGRLHDIENPEIRERFAKNVDNTGNPQFIIESVLGQGTIASPLTKYRGEHIRICRPRNIAYTKVQKILKHMIMALGTPYKMRHIFDLARWLLPWSILPRRWLSSLFQRRGEFDGEICSATIADAFQEVNFPILPKSVTFDDAHQPIFAKRNARLYTPSDFDYSPYFAIIKYPMFKPR
jgi:hypothetical protein